MRTSYDNMKRGGRKASLRPYTLLELLFVIGIAFIIMGLLLPMLGRAKRYAYNIACMSNVRQIAMGYKVYQADHRMKLPEPMSWLDDFRPVHEYVKSFKVHKCPLSDTPPVTSYDELEGGSDYLCASFLTDTELRNSQYNNGHGNSRYNFDISNPSTQTEALIATKTAFACVYDKDYHWHNGWINVCDIKTGLVKRVYGMSQYWLLDSHDRIVKKTDPFPKL